MYRILEYIVYQNLYVTNRIYPGVFPMGCCAVTKVVFIQVLRKHSVYFALLFSQTDVGGS